MAINRDYMCHHSIACCKTDRINPENLVHSCYTIDTYMRAYAHNLFPLRGRVYWENMKAAPIYPPLYTKVMGRPKRNRKKAPEEKVKKGVTIFTKSGVTMHCSDCGKANHNKKGHAKYVQAQLNQMQGDVAEEEEEIDIPEILQVFCKLFSEYKYVCITVDKFLQYKYLHVCSIESHILLMHLWIQHINKTAWCT